MPMPMSDPDGQASDLSWIKTEDIVSGTYKPGAMLHPAHPYGPCQVTNERTHAAAQ